MKQLILRLLKRFAVHAIARYKPMVIGVTGSVGKTSTKRAIRCAIGNERAVRASEGSYNTEFGFPLTILGEQSAGHSVLGWIGVLWRGWRVSRGADRAYPTVLVLEYGADKKGDISLLTQIARPQIAVVTAVSPAHTEAIGTIDDVAEEKGMLIRALPEDGVAVLNADDPRVLAMRHMVRGRVVTYGLSDAADVHTERVSVDLRHDGELSPDEVVAVLTMQVRAHHDSATVQTENVVGDAHVTAILGGMAAAMQLGIPLASVARSVGGYLPEKGRMKLIGGIKRSLLLDDTYNASPAAVHAALDVLASFPIPEASQRIAVLGDMLELGRYSEASHAEVGAHVARLPIDLFVVVGEAARGMARGALDAGMDQAQVFSYARAEEAGRFVQSRMKKGDVILVKGSQGVRMERIVKELMAEPLRAEQLLVRQSASWRDNS